MSLHGIIIVSNNSMVTNEYECGEWIEGSLMTVLRTVRDYVHKGHKLITHPLAGSVKPNETPYKSVIITKDAYTLDYESVRIIGSSIETSEKMLREKPTPDWPERVLEDFKVIDKSLIDSALLPLSKF